jgi:hypothetical protein
VIIAAIGGGAVEPAPESAWRLITQPHHAFFAAELLALWRTDGLPERPHREDLLFATREHDNGWRELDASPTVDRERGVPRDFLTVPAALRREVWTRGTERYVEERPRAALLIVQHALHLFRDSATSAESADFLAQLRSVRDELMAQTSASDSGVLENHAWLDLADRISLVACGALPRLDEPDGRTVTLEAEDSATGRVRLAIHPFPLAGATTFKIPCRAVPGRFYAGDADFAVEAASATWKELAVTVQELS